MKILYGTTTVGLATKTAVVVAADRRASSGTYVAHKAVKKIVRVADHVVLTTAGLVADTQILASLLKMKAAEYSLANKTKIPVKALASYLSLLLNTYKYSPFIVQFILAGYDDRPRLYNIEFFGDYFEELYTATGSGSPIAIGVIESEYSEDLGDEEAVALAVKAIRSSIRRDVFTGEAIDVAIIRPNGVEERSYRAG
ncbi:MAG: proteasome subunit beta [Sulfolobales archaeon]|nr:proteasome subunit beta [Sulfolobales archaeon]MDW8083067.1 proteasome subunit beta [Sulfolobales archaeon]